jgi:hypothetical protein
MINSNKCDKLNYDMKLLGSKLNNNNKNKAKWRSMVYLELEHEIPWKELLQVGYLMGAEIDHTHTQTKISLNKHEIETQDAWKDIKVCLPIISKKKEHTYCP